MTVSKKGIIAGPQGYIYTISGLEASHLAPPIGPGLEAR
jgi:hypothetical protein